jgi:thiaminase/transcriptional activator TenA
VDWVASTVDPRRSGDTTELLIASVGEYWSRITGHPFLTAIASGSLEPQAFARWVAADHAFNLDYLRFGAGLLALAPDLAACRVLGRHVRGAQATVDLLIATAERASVDLDVEPGPFTLGLSSYLRALLTHGYEVSLAALYCAERVYYDAWSAVGPQSNRTAPYWPLIQHLRSEDSADVLRAIGGLLNQVAVDGPTPPMVEAVEMIVRFELLFWSEVYVGASW